MNIDDSTTSEAYRQQCREALASEQAASLALTNGWAHVDKSQVHADWDTLYRELTPLIGHASPDSQEVQSMMDRHFAIVSRFYRPSKQAYIGMSLFYAENDDMRQFHLAYHPGMIGLLQEAIPIYAEQHL